MDCIIFITLDLYHQSHVVMVDRLASVLQDLAKRGELVKAVEELQQSARNSDADRRIQAGASKPTFMYILTNQIWVKVGSSLTKKG